jgi:hypothetical protein
LRPSISTNTDFPIRHPLTRLEREKDKRKELAVERVLVR